MKKSILINDLKSLVDKLRRNNKKIVFTNGCFDIIHPGHIHLLKKSKSMGDVLMVALNSDSSIKKIKGEQRPFNIEKDRIKILESIRFVDYVTVFSNETPKELIKLIKPDILVKGGDYNKTEIVGYKTVIQYGGKVETVALLEGYSTSDLINNFNP